MKLTYDCAETESGWEWTRFYGEDKNIPLHSITVSPATEGNDLAAVYFETKIGEHSIEVKRYYREKSKDIYAKVPELLKWISANFPQLADIILDIREACGKLRQNDKE